MRYISRLPDERWRGSHPRTLAILGSTGSIGRSALEVIRLQPERFRVAALAGGRNIPLLASQAAEFRPDCLGVLDEELVPRLRKLLPSGYTPSVVVGQSGYETMATLPGVSTVLSAQVGAAGLRATFAAAAAGKVIALANKESLVLAGRLIRQCCAQSGASILPVDSEHNAIFQCLTGYLLQSGAGSAPSRNSFPAAALGRDRSHTAVSGQGDGRVAGGGPAAGFGEGMAPGRASGVERLILTASGGPFYGRTRTDLAGVGPADALAHPNWTMGAKITIDSATLMNKGLELIEAHHLYGLPMSALDVVVHRESIIHSLVEFADGSHLAQLSLPDMRTPIAHCLGWPERVLAGVQRLDLAALGRMTFARPDEETFACLGLARQAQDRGLGSPVVLNAANEEAVAAFLEKRIPFLSIAESVREALAEYASGVYSDHDASREPESLEEILALDAEARVRTRELMTRAGAAT